MLSVIRQALMRLRSILPGRGRKPAAAEPIVQRAEPEISVDPAGVAVAGYVIRLPRRTNFHLPARIASVAHLNTPQGRKPSSTMIAGANEVRRPVYAPQQKRSVPVKPLQTATAARTAKRQSATVIEMPARAKTRPGRLAA